MVRDGIYYGIGFAAGGVFLSALLSPAYGAPLFVLAIFCLYFFRDPDRVPPSGQVAVSPADGKVVAIQHDTPETTQISIFLNIFDVHVNRSPIAGKISQVVYHHGRFMPANRAAASSGNEQNVVTIDAGDTTVRFAQIAGLIARRIVFYKHTGDDVGLGERVGLIKFGSRVDVFFGPEWEIAVQKGTRVSAGTSVLAKRK